MHCFRETLNWANSCLEIMSFSSLSSVAVHLSVMFRGSISCRFRPKVQKDLFLIFCARTAQKGSKASYF